MSGINRLLSKREKRSGPAERDNIIERSEDLPQTHQHHHHRPHRHHHHHHGHLGMFTANESKSRPEKDESKKVQAILQQLAAAGITNLKEPQIEYALRSKASQGDVKKALDLLLILEDSIEGIIRPYTQNIKLQGAENREGTTCYLDATLFAMFAVLDSFEVMLYDTFEDEPRRNLALLLRMWVNLLRSGQLITTDLTQKLQQAIAACGWTDAAKLRQQDASEAFTFITGKLELPLLTLKVDIYHTGKEDVKDDHKIVNERLLEVAIPPPPEDRSAIKLEDCLETYFNNRIEVRRHLQRRNTVQSVRSMDSSKGQAIHVETVELGSRPESPASLFAPTITNPLQTTTTRERSSSLFGERRVLPDNVSEMISDTGNLDAARRRTSSLTKREVLMPAWQFFSLLPWYTSNAPTSDDQVAAHFASKRPVLGICLKRYSCSADGTPVRLNTFIDIPLEIALPEFISDDDPKEHGPAFGKFKLSLQSVVCHRGSSLHSGHYVTLVRFTSPADPPNTHDPGTGGLAENADKWMRLDDLAPERVHPIDISRALVQESPYLLFYQVRPIEEDEGHRPNPPTYVEITQPSPSIDMFEDESAAATPNPDTARPSVEITEVRRSNSLTEIPGPTQPSRTSLDLPDLRRHSIAVTEGSLVGSTSADLLPTEPATPSDEGKIEDLPISRRGSKMLRKASKSRTTSSTGSQLALTMSKLSRLGGSRDASKEKLATVGPGVDSQPKFSRHSLDLLRSTRNDNASSKEPSRRSSSNLLIHRRGKSSRLKPPDRECSVM